MEKLVIVLVAVAVFCAVFAGVTALMAYPVMWLLNGCLAPAALKAVFGVETIGWLHAWGVLLLSGLLIKGSSVGSSSSEKSSRAR